MPCSQCQGYSFQRSEERRVALALAARQVEAEAVLEQLQLQRPRPERDLADVVVDRRAVRQERRELEDHERYEAHDDQHRDGAEASTDDEPDHVLVDVRGGPGAPGPPRSALPSFRRKPADQLTPTLTKS